MSDHTSLWAEAAEPVAGWLQPLDAEACGPDLEYAPEFLELQQAAAGKPETQFSAAEPPLWTEVRDRAAELMGRTRDLRVALLWARAHVHVEGLAGLHPVLQLFGGLLDTYWDQGLHPVLDPDDGDAFARLSVVANFDKLDGLLGDMRQALVWRDRRLGGLRVRDVEVALDRLPSRPDEQPRSPGELRVMFGELADVCDSLRAAVKASLVAVKQLQAIANDRFGGGEAVDLKALRVMLDTVGSVLPEPVPEADAAAEEGLPADAGDGETPVYTAAPARRGAGVSRIDSREDAVKGIRLICEYLERSEPTNPAQLLLRRAERLIDANFLQLIRELAPDAAAEVARVMGVHPDDIAALD